jgi:hypothetical protein
MPPLPHVDDDPSKLTSSGFEGIAPMRPRRGKESILAKTWPFFKEPIYIVALCKASECKVVMLLALHMLYSIFFSGRPARARTAACTRERASDTMAASVDGIANDQPSKKATPS